MTLIGHYFARNVGSENPSAQISFQEYFHKMNARSKNQHCLGQSDNDDSYNTIFLCTALQLINSSKTAQKSIERTRELLSD
jgi:hypothetical protein